MRPGPTSALATGTLDFVDSSVDFSSGTIAAKAKFANEQLELWPGTYVDVEIDLGVRPNTVMIPAVAVQSGQKGPFVFVPRTTRPSRCAISSLPASRAIAPRSERPGGTANGSSSRDSCA